MILDSKTKRLLIVTTAKDCGPRRARLRAASLWLAFLCFVFLQQETLAASEAPPSGRLISEYALVSANDFPQRDPRDWKLLGSNDRGKTWVTLESRQNEAFSERHQRRTFAIANPAPYETYRLQIEHVRDRRMANSVQLAEIELYGASEEDLSPNPVFTDIITAQGDNPPAESVAKVFDGRVETKWLDRPTNRITCASWIQWQYVSPAGVLLTNVSQVLALRTRAADAYRMQIEGVVGGQSDNAGGLYVLDPSGCIEVHDVPTTNSFKRGDRVLLEGSSVWHRNQVDIKPAWIRLHEAGVSPTPERITLEQPMEPKDNLKWVEAEGQIHFFGNSDDAIFFDLADGGRVMRVRLQQLDRAQKLPRLGTRVSVRGICRGAYNDQGQWVAASLWAPGLGAVTQVDETSGRGSASARIPQPKDFNASTEFTKIEQIRKLSSEQLRSRPQVKIRGIVTDLVGAFIQDDTAGIQVAFPDNESRKLTEAGMFVEVEGWGGLGDVGNPIISADHITVLGRGTFPQPQRPSSSDLISGRLDAQWIELEGVVRVTDGAHLLMICYGHEIMASIGAGSVAVVNGLVDTEVRVRGVGVTALDNQGRIQGLHLLIPSLEQLEVVAASVDPFAKPIQPIGSLLSLSGPHESYHRVRLKGILTLQENQRFFLQDDTGSAMAILKEEVSLDPRFGRSRWLFWQGPQTGAAVSKSGVKFSPGDQVEVVGFPESRGYSPVLTEVTVRKTGTESAVRAVEATPEAVASGSLDSALVSLEGIVREQDLLGSHNALALEWMGRMLQVLVSTNVELPRFVPGTRLQVTGICQIDQMPYAELGLRVGAVRVLPRSAEDLIVLARPPWWTVRRALAAMGGMAFVILAAFIWIKQLRRQVDERTKELASEIQLREQTERQRSLEKERARIAQDLHDDLGANLTQIVFLSQRVEAAQQDAQEVDRWFRLIPATARKTIQSLDEIVWAINPRHDSLESLANYLSQFAQQHMTLARVRCVLDVPTVLPAMALTAEVRHKLLLAAREALQNVATHAAASEARVALQWDENTLTIVITDNGRGFDVNHVSNEGNGLSNMRRRLEDINGRAEIVSVPGTGTTVRLVVQLAPLHGRVIGAHAN